MVDAMDIFIALEQDDYESINTILLSQEEEVSILSVTASFMRRNLNRVADFYEHTIPTYLSSEFQSHFRMTRTTFELLLPEIVQTRMIPLNNRRGRPVIPPERQVLIFLWTMANKEPNRAIADRFDVTISSVHRTYRHVAEAVTSLYPRYIKWPNANEAREISAAFEDEGGFPNVTGMIDGTHVCIRTPEYEPDVYINRKKFHPINVQVICDNNLVFLDVLAGWPGSVHDSRVLRNSGVYNNAANRFPGDSYLLGDGGYPLLR
ncbi:protein ALP1-like [Exaiptasia diaphana]|uniref:Putative nuclease HARBI1 n=1 Tax=Exaiptasia diaphana TaxID=2652724 RepID=A0A913XYZ9_EXADI|nr:protein ALP1-like [Exaiptasia diaphana]